MPLLFLPLAVGSALSLFSHHAGRFTFVGVGNFVALLASTRFYFTLGVTILWTVANLAVHLTLGVALALALNQRGLRLRGFFRVLLIVPWAIPNYISALIFKTLFNFQLGAVNQLLKAIHLQPVDWFASFSTSFAANLTANGWLGFPFVMVVTLGALQSVPESLREAMALDGASRWQTFRHLTWPTIAPIIAPAMILSAIWTFNMFNVIYLGERRRAARRHRDLDLRRPTVGPSSAARVMVTRPRTAWRSSACSRWSCRCANRWLRDASRAARTTSESAMLIVVTYIALTLACAVVLYPLAWIVKIALTGDVGANFFASPISLAPIRTSLLAGAFPRALANSLASARARLDRRRSRVRNDRRIRFFAFALSRAAARACISPALHANVSGHSALSVPLYLTLLNAVHLLGSLFGLVLVYATVSVPFSIWMLKGFFDNVPIELAKNRHASTAPVTGNCSATSCCR